MPRPEPGRLEIAAMMMAARIAFDGGGDSTYQKEADDAILRAEKLIDTHAKSTPTDQNEMAATIVKLEKRIERFRRRVQTCLETTDAVTTHEMRTYLHDTLTKDTEASK